LTFYRLISAAVIDYFCTFAGGLGATPQGVRLPPFFNLLCYELSGDASIPLCAGAGV
jgi:hypothetical protein